MPSNYDFMEPPVEKRMNRRADAFSQRLGQECQPFAVDPPKAPLFDAKKVAIVGNGRYTGVRGACFARCMLCSKLLIYESFWVDAQLTMAKLDGAKTVVVGGRCCGTVSVKSTDFTAMDWLVKTGQFKNSSEKDSAFVYVRLRFVNLPLTADGFHSSLQINANCRSRVNRPQAIWKKVAETVF